MVFTLLKINCSNKRVIFFMSTRSSGHFPDSYTTSFVPIPHIIRWSGLFDRRILTCTAPWAALHLQRTMNNDCGAYWWCLWTCVSTRHWQSSGLSLRLSLAYLFLWELDAAGCRNTITLRGQHSNAVFSSLTYIAFWVITNVLIQI